jgi:hypothetical protein
MNTTAPENAGDHDVKAAVCCSGGGIRSASYCLGALEALTADLDGRRPDLVTAVSGGSYIAAAGAVAADGVHIGAGYREGFKSGSPLEIRLRNHTHYLVPDAVRGLRGVLSLLWGALGNMFLAGSLVYVISALTGWLLAAIGGLTWTQNAVHLQVTAWQIWVPAGLAIAAAVTFVLSRLAEKPPEGSSRSWAERWSTWTAAFFALAAAATLLLVAAPALFAAVWQSGSSAQQPGTTNPIPVSVAIPIIAAGAAAFAKAAAGTISASWSRLGSGVQGTVRPWLAKAGRAVMPWLGSAFIIAGLIALSVFVIGTSTAPGYQHWQIAAAAGVFVVLHLLMDVNRSSMHDFYRDRLASAYADPARADSRLSRLTGPPELVVCAAANLRTGAPGRGGALRGVPPGRGAVSCVFTPENVELHYPESGGEEKARTSTYEDLIRPDRMTLFDVVAISGAAVAPLMGKMTSAAYRLLFGAVNLRLGVWLPRPSLVTFLDDCTDGTKPGTLKAWRGKLEQQFPGWVMSVRMASWDRIRYHNQTRSSHSWRSPSCWATAMMWRFWQPNLLLLWREVAGSNPASAKWIYVTDGGHYDNLGLVEALRHHPAHIYLIDASGDAEHKYAGLGQAIALARSELGVEMSLEPADMEHSAEGAPDGQQDTEISGRPAGVIQPFAIGTYQYADDEHAKLECEIDIIKLGVWNGRDLPWDVRAYYATHPTFPRDSTLKQLYDDEDFEAYRELGHASMKALLAHRKVVPAHRNALLAPWKALLDQLR